MIELPIDAADVDLIIKIIQRYYPDGEMPKPTEELLGKLMDWHTAIVEKDMQEGLF